MLIQRLVLGALLAGLLVQGYQVLQLFLAPVGWAMILAYVTWPAYRRLRGWLFGGPSVSALLMTLLLGITFTLPLLWLIALLRAEVPVAYQAMVDSLAHGPPTLSEPIARLPWLGPQLQQWLNQLADSNRAEVTEQLVQMIRPWVNELLAVLGDIGLNTFKFGFALLTIFFIYRDGEGLLGQTRLVLNRLLGQRTRAYLVAIGDTIRAVVYGLVLAALAQGLLAGIGYWVAGVPAPAFLGLITAIIALIPFGALMIWGAAGVWLLVTGHLVASVGLWLWGALVVSQIDNLIRPLVISSTTHIPFLLVFFGVLGGITTYGLIGLFLGPAVVAVLLAVWREWLGEQAQSDADHR